MGGRGEWVLLVWFAPSFPLGSGAKPVCPSSREDCVNVHQTGLACGLDQLVLPFAIQIKSHHHQAGTPSRWPTHAQMLLERSGEAPWTQPVDISAGISLPD